MPVYIQEAVYIKGAIKSLWTAAALPCNALCNTTTDYNAPPAYLVTTPQLGPTTYEILDLIFFALS